MWIENTKLILVGHKYSYKIHNPNFELSVKKQIPVTAIKVDNVYMTVAFKHYDIA